MRVFTATLGTETNSFSSIPTGLKSFQDVMLFRPGEHPDFPTEATGALWASRKRQQSDNWQVIEGTCAFAMPAGLTNRQVYESLRDEILRQIKEAMPLDMVALSMHGAMMAHGYPDCEGDLLSKARELIGQDTPMGVVLDCHAHLSDDMVNATDAIVLFKEYPHTDYVECGDQLLDILEAKRAGRATPVTAVFDCNMIVTLPTRNEPVKSLIDDIRQLEKQDDILSISIVHGFALGDNKDMGTKVLIVSDNAVEKGKTIAADIGNRLKSLKEELSPSVKNKVEQASIDDAIALESKNIILVDSKDNPGGGAPGDNTYFIRQLIEKKLESVCAGPLWDPQAVKVCFDAGVGATLPLRIGGKACKDSDEPLDVIATITALQKNHVQTLKDVKTPLGDSAAIRVGGIDIVLASLRDQTYGQDLFSGLGIEPKKCKYILVKSSQQFRIGFDGLNPEIVYLRNMTRKKDLVYKNISRPLWPITQL